MSADGGMTLDRFNVQVIVGDGGDQNKVLIGLAHIFSACLPAYALGVPRSQVQMYCSDDMAIHKKTDKNRLRSRLDAELQVLDKSSQDVLPSFYGEDDDNFFEYVLSIIYAFKNLKNNAPLPNCEMRIICGHSTGSMTGPTQLVCGKDQVFFHDLVEQNASVLTVIDCCLPVNAILGLLKDSNNQYKKKEKREKVLNGRNFPVACPGTTLTYGFFVSFAGHHSYPENHPEYLTTQLPGSGMTKTIGIPVMSSIMVAVKARYIDEPRDPRDLHEIAQEQLGSVQPRYQLAVKPSIGSGGPPLFDLNGLQELLDSQVLEPKEDGFNCCLYQHKEEWFSDAKMDTPLIPTGRKGHEMNAIIINYVIQEVKQWHQENKKKGRKTRFRNSELAWYELSRLMGRFHDGFDHFTLERKSLNLLRLKMKIPHGPLVRVSRDPNTYKKSPFEDWAVTCASLPKIVNKVVDGFAHGIDELRVEMGADESMLVESCEDYPFVH